MFLGWVLRSEFLKLLVVYGGGFFGLLLWGFFFCFLVVVLILIGVWWLVLEVGSGFELMGSNFSSDFAREIFRL